MMLSLDETRIKMNNLTRISDVKNAVYCENLITDDHTVPSALSETRVPPKYTVKTHIINLSFYFNQYIAQLFLGQRVYRFGDRKWFETCRKLF